MPRHVCQFEEDLPEAGGARFWEYLQDRVRGLGQLPRLAELIRQKAQAANAKKAVAVPA